MNRQTLILCVKCCFCYCCCSCYSFVHSDQNIRSWRVLCTKCCIIIIIAAITITDSNLIGELIALNIDWANLFKQISPAHAHLSKAYFSKPFIPRKDVSRWSAVLANVPNTMITHRREKIGSSLNFQGKSFEKKKLHFNPPIIRNYCYGSSLNSGSFRFVCCPFVLAPFSLWSILPIFHALKIEPSKGEF